MAPAGTSPVTIAETRLGERQLLTAGTLAVFLPIGRCRSSDRCLLVVACFSNLQRKPGKRLQTTRAKQKHFRRVISNFVLQSIAKLETKVTVCRSRKG